MGPAAVVQLLRREGRPQQTQGGRHQQCAEEALQDPEGDDERDAAAQSDRGGRRREADDADEEGLPVSEAVAELARRDQGDGEREEIAVGDPLDVRERCPEVLLDGGVGDGDDRAVEGDHRDADRHGDEGEPRMAANTRTGLGAVGYT